MKIAAIMCVPALGATAVMSEEAAQANIRIHIRSGTAHKANKAQNHHKAAEIGLSPWGLEDHISNCRTLAELFRYWTNQVSKNCGYDRTNDCEAYRKALDDLGGVIEISDCFVIPPPPLSHRGHKHHKTKLLTPWDDNAEQKSAKCGVMRQLAEHWDYLESHEEICGDPPTEDCRLIQIGLNALNDVEAAADCW